MQEHRKQFKLWNTIDNQEAKGHQMLGCQWVFKYKTDKYGRLQKCKARLVVCENQQKHHDLPTRATTLAITLLHVLLAMTAKFDFETLQLDAMNAFVHANLDKTVFMRMPPGYRKNGMVLRLNKVLYDLQWSLFLWQQKLIKEIKRLRFKTILQESCMIQKNRIIGFFYVDDIVFAYKKDQADKVKRIRKSLQQRLTIKEVSKLKWCLAFHVV